MTTCDNDHEPISFEGEFRALCPLCAMREKMAEAVEEARREEKELAEAQIHDTRVYANREEGRLNDQIDTLREAVAELEKIIKKADL